MHSWMHTHKMHHTNRRCRKAHTLCTTHTQGDGEIDSQTHRCMHAHTHACTNTHTHTHMHTHTWRKAHTMHQHRHREIIEKGRMYMRVEFDFP